MRRYAVLSVFVFLLSLFVSCSLIEPSEKKASLAIGLNVSLPESSFLQANSASHLLQFDEEPHIEDEEFNFIEYTADVCSGCTPDGRCPSSCVLICCAATFARNVYK